jgi:hypothetical protein
MDGEKPTEPQQPDSVAINREAYEASSNPLYALRAFMSCRRDMPLPKWVDDALRGMARAALNLGREHWNNRIEADKAAQQLPAAFGFVRPGWNAFTDQAARNEAAWTAFDVNFLTATLGKKEAAVAQIMEERGESRSTVFGKIKKAKKSGLSRD